MAKRTFRCSSCGKEFHLYVTSTVAVECGCGSPATVLPPKVLSPDVTETVDQGRNVKWREGQQEDIAERRQDHYWSVEVPKFVRSGVYTMQTMIENGWVYFDEKNEMHIRTKPPESTR